MFSKRRFSTCCRWVGFAGGSTVFAKFRGKVPNLGEKWNLNSRRKDRSQNRNEDQRDDIHGNSWDLKMIIDRDSYLPPFSVFIEKSDR
jgi:hypothetical protein